MSTDPHDTGRALAWIKAQAAAGNYRITQHAAAEMDDEDVLLSDVLEAITRGEVLENYPEHRRGACCLLYGTTHEGRALHVVCTTKDPRLILITVYVPLPPKWTTPTERAKNINE